MEWCLEIKKERWTPDKIWKEEDTKSSVTTMLGKRIIKLENVNHGKLSHNVNV